MINYKDIVTKTTLGKNGKPKKIRDAAFFYCPYIPLMTVSHIDTTAWTKQQQEEILGIPITIKFNTRYGVQSKNTDQ